MNAWDVVRAKVVRADTELTSLPDKYSPIVCVYIVSVINTKKLPLQRLEYETTKMYTFYNSSMYLKSTLYPYVANDAERQSIDRSNQYAMALRNNKVIINI
jgi:hypothetical protein